MVQIADQNLDSWIIILK